MTQAKENISLGLCVNGARDEFRRREKGIYSATLMKFLRVELLPRIADGSIVGFCYKSAFIDSVQHALGTHHNLTHDADAKSFATLFASRIDGLESGIDAASVAEFIDILCDAARKTYDRGCPISIEI